MKNWEILISGRVQGVGYRFFTIRKAEQLSVKGKVKNLPDGRVKIIAGCTAEILEKFLIELRRGPSLAHVVDLQYNLLPDNIEYEGFRSEN